MQRNRGSLRAILLLFYRGCLREVAAYGKFHWLQFNWQTNKSRFWLGGRLREVVAQGGLVRT